MKNAEKFLNEFGIYATELWVSPEKAFLEWLNADVPDTNVGDMIYRQTAIDAICKACANGDDYVECVERRPESTFCDEIVALRKLPSAQPEDWMERNKKRILQAGMEGREIEFRIGGRLFAIREKAQ